MARLAVKSRFEAVLYLTPADLDHVADGGTTGAYNGALNLRVKVKPEGAHELPAWWRRAAADGTD